MDLSKQITIQIYQKCFLDAARKLDDNLMTYLATICLGFEGQFWARKFNIQTFIEIIKVCKHFVTQIFLLVLNVKPEMNFSNLTRRGANLGDSPFVPKNSQGNKERNKTATKCPLKKGF